MPPWRTPEAGSEFMVKYLRLEDRVFVGNSMADGHLDIAVMDGIGKAIDEARVKDNLSVDGGLVYVKGGDIFIGGSSGSLQLPVLGKEKEARNVSLQLFREQNPRHNIVECNKDS